MYIYEDIIWFIENTALTLFLELNETWVYLRPQQKYGYGFVVRAQFWRGRAKEFAILVNRIFPTLLEAWSQQQYPARG